jgi:hypothetical protein
MAASGSPSTADESAHASASNCACSVDRGEPIVDSLSIFTGLLASADCPAVVRSTCEEGAHSTAEAGRCREDEGAHLAVTVRADLTAEEGTAE